MAKISIFQKSLSYEGGIVVQTASSGAVPNMEELYLVVEINDEIVGFGEIRENIQYLNGYSVELVRKSAIDLCKRLDWSQEPSQILRELACQVSSTQSARALVDCTLHDWMARSKGLSLNAFLNQGGTYSSPTNQTLFWSSDEVFLKMAERYYSRGYHSLKVRVGVGEFKHDLARIAYLRDTFGNSVNIAIDANGSWSERAANENLTALRDYDIEYVEQPVAPGDWDMIDRLSNSVPMPVFLDESVANSEDIDRIAERKGKVGAHLKIVKMGGIEPVFKAGQRLIAASVPVMMGQMNEGAGATAAAVHLAIALNAKHRELYGAMGLLDDPVVGLSYADGCVNLPHQSGLGVTFEKGQLVPIWQKQL